MPNELDQMRRDASDALNGARLGGDECEECGRDEGEVGGLGVAFISGIQYDRICIVCLKEFGP